MWLYGSGFPKAKSCLKPAHEPIILARRPGPMRPLGIDACRIPANGRPARGNHGPRPVEGASSYDLGSGYAIGTTDLGRWPANVAHDGSDEVLAAFAAFGESKSRAGGKTTKALGRMNDDAWVARDLPRTGHEDSGTAARFFYCAKASKAERAGSDHPTVKPLALMSWLCRLVTPPGGVILDPFLGSGTTGAAAVADGFRFIGIERDPGYFRTAKRRIAAAERAQEQAAA
jgi:site-specific DNA-methyltransferase (adenine-specific)